MVRPFRDTWDAVVACLQAAAERIGVDPSAVRKGEIGKSMPMAAPFLYVFLFPAASGDGNLTSGEPIAPVAFLRVFCGVKPQAETAEAVTQAVELAGRALAALVDPAAGLRAQRVGTFRSDRALVRLDGYTSVLAVAELVGALDYQLVPEAA